MAWVITILALVIFFFLMNRLNVFRERKVDDKMPGRLAALAPAVNGQVDGDRVIGAWQGHAVEASNVSLPNGPRWTITMTLPPGGSAWRLVFTSFGYMLQAPDQFGTEPSSSTGYLLQDAHHAQLKKGTALVARLGPLAAAKEFQDLPANILYEADSGKLIYEVPVVSKTEAPTPEEFAAQLAMLFALKESER